MGSTDYIEIPFADSVDFELGFVHGTKIPSPPDSSGGGGGDSGGVVKLAKPEQTKSFARLMLSRSRREPAMKKTVPPIKRLESNAEMGLKGLRFLDNNSSKEGEGWKAVEKRFEQFAVAGKLHKENFGRCIGMADSKEFAVELFEALARRRSLDPENSISKDDLKKFWEEMTDQNFDSRLSIFFDMCDKNGDGKLTEDEVKEVK